MNNKRFSCAILPHSRIGNRICRILFVAARHGREPSSIDERKSWRGRAVSSGELENKSDRPRYNNFGYKFSLPRLHLPPYIFPAPLFFSSPPPNYTSLLCYVYESPRIRSKISSSTLCYPPLLYPPPFFAPPHPSPPLPTVPPLHRVQP